MKHTRDPAAHAIMNKGQIKREFIVQDDGYRRRRFRLILVPRSLNLYFLFL